MLIHYIKNDYNILVANDLDTLPAAYFASKIKRIPFVYDAHEYFPELPEVVNRPFTKSVWSFVERKMAVKASKFYTINNEYQRIFKEKYDIDFNIVRNITVLENRDFSETKGDYILYQGAVNVGRGVEEMIEAMQFINCRLVICGKGDNWNACVELVKKLKLESKVEFKGFVEPEELKEITIKALMGFTFFTDDGDSYYYSLANRFFDYLHNGVPQLCINFPEYKKINDEFNIAIMVDDLKIKTIVKAANSLIINDELHTKLHNNCLIAREVLNWQNEEKVLINIYNELVAENE